MGITRPEKYAILKAVPALIIERTLLSCGRAHWASCLTASYHKRRGDKSLAKIKDSVGVTLFWIMLRLCSVLIYSCCMFSLKDSGIWLKPGRVHPRFLFPSWSPWFSVMMKMQSKLPEGHPHWGGNWTDNSLNTCWWHLFLLSSCLAGTALSALPLVLISMLFLCRGGPCI